MYVLLLRKEIFADVFSGKKTSTSRQGKRPVMPHQKLRLITPDESVSVDTTVKSVTYCKFNELSLEEAIKEGYSSVEEMKEVLKGIYDIDKDENFTLIEFELPKELKR